MEAVRLLPGDDASWPLMPVFLQRSKAFIERYLPETNSVEIIEDLKKRWFEAPFLTGYFLVLDDGGLPFGHMTSYIAESKGSAPYVFIYQAYCDKFSKLGPLAKEVIGKVTEWVKLLNVLIKDKAKIQKFEMSTWRKADVWARYFEEMGLEAVKVRSVISCNLNLE